MGTLAFILLGTLLGTGALIWDDAPTTTMIPPTGDRAPIAAAEMTENDAAPIPTTPAAVAFTPTSTSKPMTFTHVGDDTQKKLDGGDPEKQKTIIIDQEIDVEIDEDLSKLLEQVVGNYWETKINSYRQYVDRVISTEDKNELDRLRVRWEMVEKGDGLFGQVAVGMSDVNVENNEVYNHLQDGDAETLSNNTIKSAEIKLNVSDTDGDANQQIVVKNRKVEINGSNTTAINIESLDSLIGDKNVSVSVAIGNGQEPVEFDINASDFANAQTIVIRPDGNRAISDSNIQIRKSISIRHDGDGEMQNLNIGEESDEGIDESGMMGQLAPMLKMMIKMDPSESSQIMVTTWGIAERNREELDGLKATIMNDLKEFGNVVATTMKEYAAANGDEMPDGFREQIAEKSGRIDEMLEDGPIAEVIGSLYETLAEPMILLYNGSDISPVLTSAIMQPVTGQTMAASSRLKQSFPNPATDEATIAFELDEPSAATTLRLFDATGSEVRRLDLGALPTGGNSTTLDVADLAAGTYLYHLTISTANGEQVFSKKMEIAR